MFSLDEIIEGTNGRLISGGDTSYAQGVSIDSRTIKDGELFIAIRGRNFDGHNFIDEAVKKGARIIIVDRDFRFDITRGIPEGMASPRLCFKDCGRVHFVRVDDTVKALGDIAKFHRRRFNIPVIGITGSCGKTTTKDMVYEILSARYNVLRNEGTFNNLIGLPQTLLGLNKQFDMAVVEMGTNNFGEIQRLADISQPNIGIITNIGPAHLEFFGSMSSVMQEKYQLIRNLKPPYLAILNGDDKFLRKKIESVYPRPPRSLPSGQAGTVFTFGLNENNDLAASCVEAAGGIIHFRLNNKHRFRLNVLGRHNVYNALAALMCGVLFGIDFGRLKRRLSDFVLPRTRISLRRIRDYQIIDDTCNSNPLSLNCAIEVLRSFNAKGKKIFVMGDMLELGEKSILLHREAGRKIIKSGIDILITIGHLSCETADYVKSEGSDLKVYSCGCSLEARGILFNLLRPDDLILLKGSRAMEMEKVIDGL